MRGCLILLMLGVVGCGPQPPEPCTSGTGGGFFGGGGGSGGGGSGRDIGLSGKTMEVELSIARFVSCGPGSTTDEVFTEVLDPSNQKVAHTHVVGDNTGGQFSTRISFVPPKAGSYHLTARFEPSIGTAQLDVDVAEDRSAAPSQTMALGSTCSALEVTASGLVLCLAPGDTMRVYRDGVLLQSIDADDFAIAGNTVWTTRLGMVKRHVDLGGMMPLGATLTRDSQMSEVGTLIAHENDAVLVTFEGVARLKVQAGALVLDAQVPLAVSSPFVVHPRDSFAEVLLISPTAICPVVLQTGLSPTCTPRGTEVWGSDATGTWTRDAFAASLVSTTFRGPSAEAGLAATAFLLPEGGMLSPNVSRHYENTPAFLLGGRNLMPKKTAEGIVLEAYDLAPGFRLMPGSAKTARAEHSDGRQKLFTR